MFKATEHFDTSSQGEHDWTTGGDPNISHQAKIASGAFGEVHKVLSIKPRHNVDVPEGQNGRRHGGGSNIRS